MADENADKDRLRRSPIERSYEVKRVILTSGRESHYHIHGKQIWNEGG